MNTSKKVIKFILDTIEVRLPVLTFFIMFCTFLIGILFRYVFRNPLSWTYEVSVVCYAWTVVLGACYAKRSHSHVAFTLIYDALPIRIRNFFRLIGNIIILVTFSLLFKPSLKYITFMEFQKTTVFKIPLSLVFGPVLIFILIVVFYTVLDIYDEIQAIRTGKEESILKELRGPVEFVSFKKIRTKIPVNFINSTSLKKGGNY